MQVLDPWMEIGLTFGSNKGVDISQRPTGREIELTIDIKLQGPMGFLVLMCWNSDPATVNAALVDLDLQNGAQTTSSESMETGPGP
ncbi:jg27730 [Pararge aegeria aegeria]|uniref:Jg27730 protein n=1 Tax=Pararge aegeria aegeria TaxID=348720 RepID=A0A8S4S0A5_9NEOP|nr:jg27730 [Pararge aegeria aegeria]